MKKVKAQIINEFRVKNKKAGKNFLHLYGYVFGGRHFAVTIHNGFERRIRKKERTVFVDPFSPQNILTCSQHMRHIFWFLIGLLMLPVPFIYAVV